MDAKSTQVLMSSVSSEWETPEDFFAKLSRRYGPFDLDPAATEANAKCSSFYTIKENGLSQPWFGNVFLNPPYGRGIGEWISKAWKEYISETCRCDKIVLLLPSRTDTKWWHELIMPNASQVLFVKGRLTFEGAGSSAPFPSVVVVFGETVPFNDSVYGGIES